ADIDQDGDPDIVVANVNSANSVYLNSDEGTRWTEVKLGGFTATTYGLDIGDLNLDGYPDLGFGNSDSFNRIFYNTGPR
ncbi:MAG: VCBS repeat-containing protein, partial [bacterium]